MVGYSCACLDLAWSLCLCVCLLVRVSNQFIQSTLKTESLVHCSLAKQSLSLKVVRTAQIQCQGLLQCSGKTVPCCFMVMTVSLTKATELLKMPLRVWIEPFIRWRLLANTIEWFVLCIDAGCCCDYCSIYLLVCFPRVLWCCWSCKRRDIWSVQCLFQQSRKVLLSHFGSARLILEMAVLQNKHKSGTAGNDLFICYFE